MLKYSAVKRKASSLIRSCSTHVSTDNKSFDTRRNAQILSCLSKDAGPEYCTNLNKNKADDILALSVRLRKLGVKSDMSCLNHVVVKDFSYSNVNDLVRILENRLVYGVYLDDYSGYYILHFLTNLCEYNIAARICVILMSYGDVKNELTKTMIINAIYMYASCEVKENKSNEKSCVNNVKEKKIRVKYIRNLHSSQQDIEKDFEYLIGTILTKLMNGVKNIVELNLYVLGLVLSKRYDDAAKLLVKNGQSIHKEILEISLRSTENDKFCNEFLITIIKNLRMKYDTLPKKGDSFEIILRSYVNEVVTKGQSTMLEKQQMMYNKGLTDYDTKLNEDAINQSIILRKKNMKNIYKALQLKQKYISFFKQESIYDLQVENMKQSYPKTWFGKKKRVKVIDNEYVPPEIMKRL